MLSLFFVPVVGPNLPNSSPQQGTILIDLLPDDPEYIMVEEQVRNLEY